VRNKAKVLISELALTEGMNVCATKQRKLKLSLIFLSTFPPFSNIEHEEE